MTGFRLGWTNVKSNKGDEITGLDGTRYAEKIYVMHYNTDTSYLELSMTGSRLGWTNVKSGCGGDSSHRFWNTLFSFSNKNIGWAFLIVLLRRF
jgi:hypothetical protein